MKDLLPALRQPVVVGNALRVAAVVGTVLNLINQGERLLDLSTISWLQVALNYLVPYAVASYSAARMQLDNEEIGACDRIKR